MTFKNKGAPPILIFLVINQEKKLYNVSLNLQKTSKMCTRFKMERAVKFYEVENPTTHH